ncbi:MAG: T9SS type A sorting domain-containing protein [Chitinivibrionales bacterium]|nr:T9SS type A sorting domain-containing protein [Chitinivibrionales bacterium]
MHRTVALAIAAFATWASSQTMDVHLHAGTVERVPLDDITKVTYELTPTLSLLVHTTDGLTDTSAITDIRKITFDVTTGTRHDMHKVALLKNALLSIVPNPIGRVASVSFALGSREHVRVEVYNAKGELVRTIVDRRLPTGTHRAVWDTRTDRGAQAVAGAYLFRVTIGDKVAVRRLMMVR